MPTSKTLLNIFDLLSSRSATEKIKNISGEVTDKSIQDYDKQLSKQLSDLLKRIDKIEKTQISDLSDVVVSNEDNIRSLIRDELGQVFLQLYIKRNSWQ